MQIVNMSLMPMGTNCVIIVGDNSHTAIVDPGGDPARIIAFIEKNQLVPVMVLLTHGHFDHIMAVSPLIDKYNIPLMMHKDDEHMLGQSELAAQFGIKATKTPAPEVYLEDGQILKLGDEEIKVIHTPGHSEGSLCFYMPSINTIATGDTLFQEGIGRTDFPGGDINTIAISIKDKLYTLPDNTKVFPGHGDRTTIGQEKQYNPFVRGDM